MATAISGAEWDTLPLTKFSFPNTVRANAFGFPVNPVDSSDVVRRLIDETQCAVCLKYSSLRYKTCAKHFYCRTCLGSLLTPVTGHIPTKRMCPSRCPINKSISEFKRCFDACEKPGVRERPPLELTEMTKLTDDLLLHCPYSKHCSHKIKYISLDEFEGKKFFTPSDAPENAHHLESCLYKPVRCNECKEALPLGQLEKHIESHKKSRLFAQEIGQLQRKYQDTLEKNKRIEKQNDDLLKRIKQVGLENSDLNNRIRMISDVVAGKNTENAVMLKQNEFISKERDNLAKRINEKQEELKAMEKEYTSKLEEIEGHKYELLKRLESLSMVSDGLTEKLEEKQTALEAKCSDYEKVVKMNEQMKKQITEAAKTHHDSLTYQVELADGDKEALRGELKNCREELEAAKLDGYKAELELSEMREQQEAELKNRRGSAGLLFSVARGVLPLLGIAWFIGASAAEELYS